MSDLEAVVRPSQSQDYAPARTYYQPGQIGVPNVILRFGRGSGQGKTLQGSFSSQTSSYMTQYVNEKKNASFGR